MSIGELITFVALFGFVVVVLPLIFIVIDDWRKGL
jgi:hypothetical protein